MISRTVRGAASMSTAYYDAIDKMEKQGVDPEYINGWASGFLHNPKREEQRVSQAYDAGYARGWERNPEGFDTWIRK
jgi:hypothetical protein